MSKLNNLFIDNAASNCEEDNSFKKELNHTKQLKICFIIDRVIDALNIDWTFCNLLEKMVKSGYQITLLVLYPQHFDHVRQLFLKNDIRLVLLNYSGPVISSLSPAVHSYHVMHWMLENGAQFDIVHFPLTGGLAYYTLLAKHQGWAFQHIVCCVDSHFSTLWHKHIHKEWIEHIDDLAADFLEKESVRFTDYLISHDEEILNWMKTKGWQLPQHILFVPKESDEIHYFNLYKKIQADQIQSLVFLSSSKQENNNPLVSICLTHFNRPQYLSQALESIRKQDYAHFEVILIDDASTQPEAIAYLDSLIEEFKCKGWKMIFNKKNLFPGAARNLAALQSQGEYLFFMDDDNYAKPNQISIFVKVAKQVNADILTCAMDVFAGSYAPDQHVLPIHRFLPIGAAASLGLYLNMFGDMNALIKKKVYQALNGLTEDRGIGGEDWDLYSRAVLQGYHLETIPQALFWYRDTPSSITKTTHLYANSLRGIRSYLEAVPPFLQNNLMLSRAQQEKLQKLLIEHNSFRKLFKRCCQLFFSRAYRAISQPRRSIKRIVDLIRR